MIYATSFNPETRLPTSISTDSGFESLEQVRLILGEPKKETPAFLIYPGDVIFSRIAWFLGYE